MGRTIPPSCPSMPRMGRSGASGMTCIHSLKPYREPECADDYADMGEWVYDPADYRWGPKVESAP